MRHLNEQSLVVAVPLRLLHGQLPPGRQESDFQLCKDCESVTLEEFTRGVVQIAQLETFAPAPEQKMHGRVNNMHMHSMRITPAAERMRRLDAPLSTS